VNRASDAKAVEDLLPLLAKPKIAFAGQEQPGNYRNGQIAVGLKVFPTGSVKRSFNRVAC
jgi:hypothetical protein